MILSLWNARIRWSLTVTRRCGNSSSSTTALSKHSFSDLSTNLFWQSRVDRCQPRAAKQFSYGRTKVAVRRRVCSGMGRQADSHCSAGEPFLAVKHPLASWQRSQCASGL
eukprot:IDg5761t1